MNAEKITDTAENGQSALNDWLGPYTLPQLNACPFCGKAHTLKLKTAQAIAEEDYDYGGELCDHSESWAVLCDASKPKGPGGCGASGGFFSTEEEAVQAWNKRS